MITPTSRATPPDRRRSGGQVLVLFSLSLVALLAMAGLVIDLGGSWAQARTEQKVADVAALAGAAEEANGGTRTQIIAAAVASVVANGYLATEATVNIPPTSGAYAPGGAESGPLSANDCTPGKYPCWVEVVINRAHTNSFSRVVGFESFGVTARGVAVGGIANTALSGVSPIMFNYESVTKHGKTKTKYCDPQPAKCSPNSSWPLEPNQFAWTTYCVEQANCNVSSDVAKAIIEGGGFRFNIDLNMYLGPHNHGQKTSVCHALLATYPPATYPDGTDLTVSINDDNGNLVGLWIWHLDTAGSDCEGAEGEVLSGWFVSDVTPSLPLTITPGGGTATFGRYVVRLVE